MSKVKWVYPNMENLGVVLSPQQSNGFFVLSRKQTAEWSSQMTLNVKSGYAFGCCGAGELNNLTGSFTTDKDLQETALALYNFFATGCITYYAIAATYQLLEIEKNPKSLLKLLTDLGMIVVHKTPNRNHGPNDMHMLVLDPVRVNEHLIRDKYLWKEPSTGMLLPKYVEAMKEKDQQALMDKWAADNAEAMERRRKESRAATEKYWMDRANMAQTLLYTIRSDVDRRAAYEKRGILDQHQPQVSEKVKQTFFNYLRAHGWSNSNEQQSNLSQSNSVGFAQDFGGFTQSTV